MIDVPPIQAFQALLAIIGLVLLAAGFVGGFLAATVFYLATWPKRPW